MIAKTRKSSVGRERFHKVQSKLNLSNKNVSRERFFLFTFYVHFRASCSPAAVHLVSNLKLEGRLAMMQLVGDMGLRKP
jgi:hypothetical protein